MSKMCNCKSCGAEIAQSAKSCPHCGAPNRKKMGCFSSFLCMLLIFVTIIAVAAIIGGAEDSPTTAGTPESTSGQERTEDTMILDSDEMTVWYQKAVDGKDLGVSGAFYLWLKIENKTDTEVVVNLESADVDGESVSMVMTGVPLQIRPGNSGATGFIFTTSQLSIDSVADAEQVTFKVVMRNAETYSEFVSSDYITVDLHK